MPATDGKAPRIVAGVDGSASARSALRWAVRQAELTGGSIDAVTAWHFPASYGGSGMAPFGEGVADFAGWARKTLAEEVAAAAGDSAVEVRTQVTEGTPRRRCSMRRRVPTCSWWAAGGTAVSPRRCSAR